MTPSPKKSLRSVALVVSLFAFLVATSTTRAQTITNTFTNTAIDLVTNGVLGTGFDGADLALGDVPGGNNAGIGNGATLQADTALFPGYLSVQTINSAWGQGGPGDDGFFAFNIIDGDFTASVEMAPPYNDVPYVFAGLMARAISDGTGGPFDPTGTNASENWVSLTVFQEFGTTTMSENMTNGTSIQTANSAGTGGPFDPTGTNASENWVSLTVFQEFGTTTMSENMTNGTSIQTPNSSALETSLYLATNDAIYLQIKRTGDTFILSDSADGATWTAESTNTRPDLHGVAMQVGLEEGTYSGNSPIIYFANYGVTGTNTIKPPASDPTNIVVSAPISATSLNVSWTAAPGSDGS